MNSLLLAIPVFIGIVTIVQTGLNRQIGYHLGLSTAVLLNGAMVCVLSLGLALVTKLLPNYFPELLVGTEATPHFRLWYIIPGICGFIIILGLPYAMAHLGALRVFVCFVSAQVIGSLAWDLLIDKMAFSTSRFLGACLTLMGVFLVVWR